MRILLIGSISGHKPGYGQSPQEKDKPLLNAASELGYVLADRNHTILIRSGSKNCIDVYVFKGVLRFCNEKRNKIVNVEMHCPRDK